MPTLTIPSAFTSEFTPSFILVVTRFNLLLYPTVLSVLITILLGISHVPGDIAKSTSPWPLVLQVEIFGQTCYYLAASPHFLVVLKIHVGPLGYFKNFQVFHFERLLEHLKCNIQTLQLIGLILLAQLLSIHKIKGLQNVHIDF